MESKIYTSFEEIEYELEILQLEKDLNYQKLVLSIEKTKDNLQLQNIKRELFLYFKEKLTASFGNLLVYTIPYILNFLKRKRG